MRLIHKEFYLTEKIFKDFQLKFNALCIKVFLGRGRRGREVVCMCVPMVSILKSHIERSWGRNFFMYVYTIRPYRDPTKY